MIRVICLVIRLHCLCCM